MSETQRLEERIAHLIRVTEDLSDVVARQERDLASLARRVQMLVDREAEREIGDVPITRPPHW